jgi:simple sugar transport system permease protein
MNWSAVFGIGLFVTGMQLALPTALAAVGECFSENAGTLNLGLEGMMLSGALASFIGDYYTGSAAVGVIAGIGAGVLMGVVMAFLSVWLKTEQVINGIALVLFASGLTAFIYDRLFSVGTSPVLTPLHDLRVPGLASIPWLGPVFFDQNGLFYIALVLALGVWGLLYRTRFGLSTRAVGEKPAAADAAAIHVDRTRTVALLICGAFAGLGGAVLIVGDIGLFQDNITNGRGFVAVALVIFGRWNPLLVLLGAFMFGLVDALQLRIQTLSGGTSSAVPYEFFQALPYLLTLAVMVTATVVAKRSAQPSALGVPYLKEVSD